MSLAGLEHPWAWASIHTHTHTSIQQLLGKPILMTGLPASSSWTPTESAGPPSPGTVDEDPCFLGFQTCGGARGGARAGTPPGGEVRGRNLPPSPYLRCSTSRK